ncbi:helix-turn-helix domain-containing protein [Brevibacillus brevis]|uniref:helix-turn-helix domain-containing protein n=1 Tax=Brevibacillus brevis TaxID=1393 RepID=UPI0037CC6410
MSDFLKLVGEKIRYIRKARGLTQESLAERSDLSFSYISDVERGERNISLASLEKIIIALDVMPGELFNFQNLDINPGIDDKRMIIEVIRSLLMERQTQEVKFIHQITKEFIRTVDTAKN